MPVEPDLDGWRELVARRAGDDAEVRIGVVGKYVGLQDAYISVREALHHAGWAHNVRASIEWIDSQQLET